MARSMRDIVNLMSNAAKYGRGKPIDVTVAQKPGRAFVAVRDRGIGIAEADRERIFRRFERAASPTSYGGLGLGLWIVREVTRAHGGSVGVESELGVGAEFTVELPLDPPREAARAGAP